MTGHVSDTPESTADPVDAQSELTRRLRVLLYARPLLQLRRNEAHRQQGDLGHYDLLVVALAIFDLVVEHTGLDEEMTAERLVPRLSSVLESMDRAEGVEPDPVRHAQLVDDVLGWLLNDRERRAPFQESYLDTGEAEAVQRTLEFRLLDTHFQADKITLRLTPQSVNLYLSALDIDIESAQAATEAVLDSQIRRGKLESAVGTARAARAQSLIYQQKIKGILQDTRRDVRRVDWKETVPVLLEEAHAHTATRLVAERNILHATDERLDHIDETSAEAPRLADIAALVDDCYQRHLHLQGIVMRARGVFLDAQVQQEFKPRRSGVLPNLQKDVLERLLRMPARDAEQAGLRMAQRLMGPSVPRIFSLGSYLEWAMQPRREVTVAATRVEPRELSELSLDLLRFPDEVRAAGDATLLEQNEPVRLSTLLPSISANGNTDTLREYIALRVLNLFAPEVETMIPVTVKRLDEEFEACGMTGDDFEIRSHGENQDV